MDPGPSGRDALPSATSLARVLLVLARARATGVLKLLSPAGGGRGARLAFVDGTPRALALEGDDAHPLGDLLAEEGSLDLEAHARALDSAPPTEPVGRWLVAQGVASAPAVAHALRRQMRRRMANVFEWPAVDYRFLAGRRDPCCGVEMLEEPVEIADLVLGAMRERVESVALSEIERGLGAGEVRPTELGAQLLARATLWPEEAALWQLLRGGRPVPVASLVSAVGGRPRALRTLYALRLLQAVAPPGPESLAYPLLLRKRRQMRARASAAALLDLPESARADDARRALRRLAGRLHPDRFGDAAPAAIRRVSGEVMSALVRAEADLRGRGPA